MNSELYRVAADACQVVYDKHQDLGTTEFNNSFAMVGDEFVQILAIAGTNEPADWWKNLNLWSKQGIKKPAWDAAHEIHKHFPRDPDYKLLVTGHSKAGPTAVAYKRLFGADYCVTFAPARGLRYWANRKMEDTALFIDPDDPVSKVGFISFGHPICEVFRAENDHLLPSVGDHGMENWVRFTEGLA